MGKISEKTTLRIDWVDALRGFAIFLVVYGHNFPITEKYIYSFHMPLFIFLAGVFHPKQWNKDKIIYRAKSILIPYFMWSFMLFLVWFFLGRNYGESSRLNLSVFKNIIGVFYAQGGREYMDWGIPMWFLPAIFLTFLFFGITEKISGAIKYAILLFFISLGFALARISGYHFFWSFDVALVSLIFYSLGYYFKHHLVKLNGIYCLLAGTFHFYTFLWNDKIDMYRSQYGDIALFTVNAFLGILFYVGLFKLLPKIKILIHLGKNTIPILATQIRAMTFIKLLMMIFFGVTIFSFSELEKLLLTILQIILILPILYIVNKYFPILNGFKKNR